MLVIQLHSSHFSSRLFVFCPVRAEQSSTKTYNGWSQSRIKCMSSINQNPDTTFMVHISTAHPGGLLSQQVQRSSSSIGILAEAADAGSFVSNTVRNVQFSVEPSIHDLTLLPAPGGHSPAESQLLGLPGTFITSFF